jgi:hypothetical protein
MTCAAELLRRGPSEMEQCRLKTCRAHGHVERHRGCIGFFTLIEIGGCPCGCFPPMPLGMRIRTGRLT